MHPNETSLSISYDPNSKLTSIKCIVLAAIYMLQFTFYEILRKYDVDNMFGSGYKWLQINGSYAFVSVNDCFEMCISNVSYANLFTLTVYNTFLPVNAWT